MSPEAVRAVADAIQWVVLGVVIATLITALYAGRRWPSARAYLFGLVTLTVHSVVFYVCALARVIPAPWVSLWSAALRLHAYVYILAMLALFVAVVRRPWWPDGEPGPGEYPGPDDDAAGDDGGGNDA